MVDEQLSGGSPASDAQTPDTGSSEAQDQGQAQVESSAPEAPSTSEQKKAKGKPKRNDADRRVAEVQQAYTNKLQETEAQYQRRLQEMEYEFKKRMAPEDQHQQIDNERLNAELQAMRNQLQQVEQEKQAQEAKTEVSKSIAEEVSDLFDVEISYAEVMDMIEVDDGPVSVYAKASRLAKDKASKAQKEQKRAQHAQVNVGSGAAPDLDPVQSTVKKAIKGETNYRSAWAAAFSTPPKGQ